MLGEGKASSGKLPEKQSQQVLRLLCRFRSGPPPLIRVSRDLVILLFLIEREAPLQVEISLVHGNVSFGRVAFSELLRLLFPKDNQLEIILHARETHLGGLTSSAPLPHPAESSPRPGSYCQSAFSSPFTFSHSTPHLFKR